MKYHFKQAAHIRPKGKPGKTFPLGVHEVPEHYEYDPYFLKLVSAGLVSEPDAARTTPDQGTKEENAKKLLESLVHRRRQSKVAAPGVAPGTKAEVLVKGTVPGEPLSEDEELQEISQEEMEEGAKEGDDDFLDKPKDGESKSKKSKKW